MNKTELTKLLNYYDDLYYNKDQSEISDFEYDSLKKLYVTNYGEYDYVPGKASDKLKKYNHTTLVNSLGKVKMSEPENIRKELERLWPVIIQNKFDGLTIVSYPDGNDVTRGNGHVGEIVTNNFAKVNGVGNRLDEPVRCEVLMLKSEFERINQERIAKGLEPYQNTRNAAAGMMRNLDENKVEGLVAFAYNILYQEENNNSFQQTQILKENKWNIADSFIPKTIDEAMDYILNFDRNSLDYDIDGLVIKHNGNKKFGSIEHNPLNAIAVKFLPQGEWTHIKSIDWTAGRTGVLTPVAHFEPINISGSTIQNATLHNYSYLDALNLLKLHFGEHNEPLTRVHVIKSNDVIPRIDEVVQPKTDQIVKTISIEPPINCPFCGGPVKSIKSLLYCKNPNCNSKIISRLINMCSRDAFNIEGISIETAKKLLDKYTEILNSVLTQAINTQEVDDSEEAFDMEQEVLLRLEHMHPSFIYELTLIDLKSLPGFAEVSARKLYNNIRNSKNIDFDKFLTGCGIPLIGKKVSHDIAEFYCSINMENPVFEFTNDYYEGFPKLMTLKGIGKETIKSLSENFQTMIQPFGDYKLNIKPIKVNKKADNQLTFVITGEFPIVRERIKELILKNGHKVSNSVSGKTSYLLAAPGEESTNKYKDAIKKGIKIINTLDELYELLGG